jgi:serpin B
VVSACGDGGTGPSNQPPLLTALPRTLTAAEVGIAEASNRFAFGLLAQARTEDAAANIFLSPLSATMALGMTMGGAANETFDEMRATLGFGTLSGDEINAGYKGLLALLAGLDPGTDLRVANAIWAQEGFPFLPSFITAGQTWFDAEVRNADFAAPATLTALNDWVSEKTNNKIPKLLDQFDPWTVMVLLNAVYFKGSWRDAFEAADTRAETFHAAGGPQTVPTMRREGTMRYLDRAEFQAVDLLYGNGAYAMTIVLPREGTGLDAVLPALGAAEWQAMTGQFSDQKVALFLPKFRMEYKRDLSADLRAMGMVRAFDDQVADFSRMAPAELPLFISSVVQKTFVDVNEEGTEAAAATVVQVGVTSAPLVHQMRVNRPFLVAIRERFSGTILFLGQVSAIPAG